MSGDYVSHSFASELRAAVDRRGLPLSRIQARLAAAGHPVAVSTISQWQSGHRVPRTERSLEVVAALESILEVSPGVLRQLALSPASSSHLSPSQRGIVPYGDTVEQLLGELGARSFGALRTVSVHDRLTVSPRGAVRRRRTALALRAASPADRYVMTHEVDPGGDVAQVSVRARGGCRVGRVTRSAATGVLAVELHLDRRLGLGETALLDVQIDDDNDIDSRGYYRWTTREVPVLLVEATFDRRRVPSTVHSFSRARADSPDEQVTELTIAGGEQVHLVRQPAPMGVHGIRWTWPED